MTKAMGREEAETVALRALAFVAGDEALLGRLQGATGASLDDLRAGAQEPAMLAAVLEFLTSEDRWILAFAEAEGLRPEDPMRALMALPGGRRDEWP